MTETSTTTTTNTGEVPVAAPMVAPRERPSTAHTVTFRAAELDFFYGGMQALSGVNLDIRRNEITALIGPSGCGKSTFLRCLNRMNDLIPGARIAGKITFRGIDIYAADVSPTEVRRG